MLHFFSIETLPRERTLGKLNTVYWKIQRKQHFHESACCAHPMDGISVARKFSSRHKMWTFCHHSIPSNLPVMGRRNQPVPSPVQYITATLIFTTNRKILPSERKPLVMSKDVGTEGERIARTVIIIGIGTMAHQTVRLHSKLPSLSAPLPSS